MGPARRSWFGGPLSASVLSAAPLLALTACDGDGAVQILVGRECTEIADCGERATSACIATWRDGYCTELACNPGSCPSGTVCAQGLMFPGVAIEDFCVLACEDTSDCRDGYTCVPIGAAQDACLPENPR